MYGSRLNILWGFIFWIPIFIIIGAAFHWMNPDFIQVNVVKDFEQEYSSCLGANQQLTSKINNLKEEKEVICKCPTSVSHTLTAMWAFFVGAISYGYFILVGYPWIRDRLEKKKGKPK